MTSMRERDIGAISGRLPYNLGELAYMSALDLSHDLHKSCMYDQCKHKAFFAAIHMFCAFDIRARAQKESNLVVQDR